MPVFDLSNRKRLPVSQDNNAARAQLFERAGFSGKKMEIQDDIPNLMSRYSLNRVASIRVLGGA